MTSCQPGPVAVFHAHGDEQGLAARLDAALFPGKKRPLETPLPLGGLRHGWLAGKEGEWLDEVMLAKPADGVRILMLHGGNAVRESMAAFLRESGWLERRFGEEGTGDAVADPLLARCLTASQIASVLEAREAGVTPPAGVLAVRRLVLAGPPNVGKSSLMNRLAGFSRSFVHDAPGVTLDVVDEVADIGGYAVRIEDLPGFSGSDDSLEQAAWERAAARLRQAEAVLFVCDAATPWDESAARAARAVAAILAETPRPGPALLLILNKADLPRRLTGAPWQAFFPGAEAVSVCSLPGGDAAVRVGEAVGELLRRSEFQ